MQKKIILLLTSLLGSAIFVFFSSISFGHVYDYALSEQKIKLISSNSGDIFTSITTLGLSNTFVLAVAQDDADTIEQVIWRIDGMMYMRELDHEWQDDTGYMYTFPLVTDGRHEVEVALLGWSSQSIDVRIITTDTQSSSMNISFHTPFTQASDVVRVISRREWWADEWLRYRSNTSVEKQLGEWESRGKIPRIVNLSQSDVDAMAKDSKIGEILQSLHPESFSVVKRIRYENGKKLIWPLTYSSAVDRIIVHHTAESASQATLDDKVVLRSIYLYHTQTRGWGDIGYNYIVWKDGTIFEWRSGGDYVQGAHAYGNNLWTTGVALLGNFESNSVPDRQLWWLVDISTYLAQKYGINVWEDTVGFRTCGKWSATDCLIDQVKVKKLDGHTGVWYTACPWKDLEDRLGALRTTVNSNVWNVWLIKNTINIGTIEPTPKEDTITYVYPNEIVQPKSVKIATNSYKNSTTLRANPSFGWPRIKIKLSYPILDTIDISIASIGMPSIRIWDERIFGNRVQSIKVWIVWNNTLSVRVWNKIYTWWTLEYNAPIVQIDSWSRIPTWDTSKKYNDNLFRGKIILRNEDGKLLVVNELPLEDYLRWLGEVSNTDEKEKIKTITVAARSYARYYMDRRNRKYNTLLYDGSDDPNSFQKYLWYSYELRSPIVSQQVRLTRWQVITYWWNIIKAWYFSSSDGRTRSYREYCVANTGKICEDVPYLQSVDDPAWVWKTRAWHGVGISWIWATAMAQEGKSYKEIIQYYLKWVEIQKK